MVTITPRGHRLSPPRKHRRRLACRGVRGATTAADNTAESILRATRELLYTLVRANDIVQDEVASVYFTTTPDLTATYPALAARQLGWYDAALICGHEMAVPSGLPRCIRILMHWNTRRSQAEIQHIYLHEAQQLRPDRCDIPPIPPEEMAAVLDLSRPMLADDGHRPAAAEAG